MANINIFDQTLKIIARNYADVFLRLAFPDLSIQLIGTEENVELALPMRSVDFVHRITHKGEPYLLHVEFQLKHEIDLPQRLHSYNGALAEQFDLPVVTLVLYLRPRQSKPPDAYEVQIGEHVVNRFTYPVIQLWDFADEIWRGEYPELAPLLVMITQEPDASVLQQERELILQEVDTKKRATLLALAVAIAARHFDKAFLWQFFREEVEQMREATFIEDWIQEGLQEGQAKGQQESILEIVTLRFTPSLNRYRQIESVINPITDTDELRALLRIAVQAQDLTEFEQALSE